MQADKTAALWAIGAGLIVIVLLGLLVAWLIVTYWRRRG